MLNHSEITIHMGESCGRNSAVNRLILFHFEEKLNLFFHIFLPGVPSSGHGCEKHTQLTIFKILGCSHSN